MTRLPREFIAIDVGTRHLAAAHLRTGRDEVDVQRCLRVDIPSEVDAAQVKSLGAWCRITLEEAGFPNVPLVFVLPRQAVGLKRLRLPAADDADLPGMVRLRLAGQLPFSVDEGVVDYAIVRRTDEAVDLIGAAVRNIALQRCRELSEAMNYKLAVVTLRPLSTAALLARRADQTNGTVLAVDLRCCGEVEIVVESGGGLLFARSAELSNGSTSSNQKGDGSSPPGSDLARRVATEASRSWMSYRLTEDAPDVDRVVVLAPPPDAEPVAEAVRRELDRPTEILRERAKVNGSSEAIELAWPLVGAGVEAIEARDRIDFLNPKKAPDLAAQRRVRLLGGIAALVVVCLFGWQFAQRNLGELRTKEHRLKTELDELVPRRWALERRRKQVEHLQKWELSDIDFLEHLEYISGALPDTRDAVLGSFSASLSPAKIEWDRRDREWALTPSIGVIRFNGAAIERRIADSLREQFVNDPLYNAEPVSSDSTTGGKTEYNESFALRLTTARERPNQPESRIAEGTSEQAPTAAPNSSTAARVGGGDGG